MYFILPLLIEYSFVGAVLVPNLAMKTILNVIFVSNDKCLTSTLS